MAFFVRIAPIIALVLGSLYVLLGLYMLYDPLQWYWSIPGVPDRGPFNQHFIRDVGIVFMVTGAGLIIGARMEQWRIPLWGVAGAWHGGHALFHVWEVVAGLCTPWALAQDFLGVTVPGLLLITMAVAALHEQPDTPRTSG